MNCIELEQPEILVKAFSLEDKSSEHSIYNCFIKLYYNACINCAYRKIFIKYAFYPADADNLLKESFRDAFIAFRICIEKKGFENRAAVKTLFITIFLRILARKIGKDYRHNKNYYEGDPEIPLNLIGVSPMEDAEKANDRDQEVEKRRSLFRKAFPMLDKRCQTLIRWRCLEELSIEEIARRSGVSEKKVITDEIYRCKQRLKQIIADLK